MGVKNFRQLRVVLRNSFDKIRRDIRRLEETDKDIVKNLSVVRENLLEFNNLKKRVENIEEKIEEKEMEYSGEIEGDGRGFFSKLFFWRAR